MSVTISAQGDWTSPSGAAAEESIVTTAVPGVYRFHLDRLSQNSGDDIRVIIKQAIRNVGAGATSQIVSSTLLDDAPVDDTAGDHTSFVAGPFDCPFGIEIILEQEAGVTEIYPWALVRVG